MTLSKQLQNLVKGSAVIKTPKQALVALFESVINTLPKQNTFLHAFPNGYMRCNPEFANRTIYCQQDLVNPKAC